jgi:hypothetical protein
MARNRKRRATGRGKQRVKRVAQIAKRVALGGIPRLAVRAVIKKVKPKLQKYVEQNSQQEPAEDDEQLAVQVATIRQKKIQELQDSGENDADTPAEAEELMEEEQADELESESYEGESDAFTEEALGAVLGVAKGAINKMRKKRFAKGKKFLGKSQKQFEQSKKVDVNTDGMGNIQISGVTNEGATDPLSESIRDAKRGAIETNLRQYLPIILIAVVVFLMFKKK